MGSLSAEVGLDDASTEVEELRQRLGRPSTVRPLPAGKQRWPSSIKPIPSAGHAAPTTVVLEHGRNTAAPALTPQAQKQRDVRVALAAKKAELAAQRSKTLRMIDQLPPQSPQRAEAEQAAAAAAISPTTRDLVDRALSLAAPAVGPATPERPARSETLVLSPHSTLKAQLAQQRQRAALRSAVATAKLQNDGGALAFQAAVQAAKVRASAVKGILRTASDEESSPSGDGSGSDQGRTSKYKQSGCL